MVLSDEDVVQPDVLFVSAAKAGIVTEDNVQGAPDLVVDILSDATRKKDEMTKRKLYERFGVTDYWIVDPELETVTVFRLSDRLHPHRRTFQGIARHAHHTPPAGFPPPARRPLRVR